jgi:hypothetical protein
VSGQLHAPAALRPGKSPWNPLGRRLDPRAWRRENSWLEFRPSVVLPVSSRYTDCAIRTPYFIYNYLCYWKNFRVPIFRYQTKCPTKNRLMIGVGLVTCHGKPARFELSTVLEMCWAGYHRIGVSGGTNWIEISRSASFRRKERVAMVAVETEGCKHIEE